MQSIGKPYIILLAILILAGGFLRFYKISAQSYWIDESITILNVQSIENTGNSTMYSGDHYSCPLYCYPTALIAKILGNNPFSYRFQAAIFGILFILVIFLIAEDLFDRRVAALSAFFATFSYWQIAWSREARWYTLFECFFWLSILFFNKALRAEKKAWPATHAIIFTIAAMVAHPLGYLLPVIFIFWICYEEWETIGPKALKTFAWSLPLIAAIFFFCDFVIHVSLFAQLSKDIYPRFLLPQYSNFYLRNYWLFFVFGIVAFLEYQHEKQAFKKLHISLLLAIFFSYFFFIALLGIDLNYGHLFQITPVLYILGSVGILHVYGRLKTKYEKIFFGCAVLIIFFTVGGGILVPQTNYYLESDNPDSWLWMPSYSLTEQPDWNDAYAYVSSHKSANDIVISTVPQFNEIFLNEPGYWLKFVSAPTLFEKNGKDIYVGSTVLHNLRELQNVTAVNHGYLVLQETHGRSFIDSDIIPYVVTAFSQVFYEKTGDYNEVWVYRF